MKRSEFYDLKIDDICIIKQGLDKGKRCRVVYIERDIEGCYAVVVKAVGCEFDRGATNGNRYLKLTYAGNLDLVYA